MHLLYHLVLFVIKFCKNTFLLIIFTTCDGTFVNVTHRKLHYLTGLEPLAMRVDWGVDQYIIRLLLPANVRVLMLAATTVKQVDSVIHNYISKARHYKYILQ